MKQNKSSACAILVGIFHFQIIFILCHNSTKLLAFDSEMDRESLLALKSSVHDPRNAISGWNRSVSHCTWAGVSCSGSGSRVRSLNLPSLGLSGTIPSSLSNLTSLENLNLFNNSFYGEIPLNLGNLSSLRTIILAGNSVNGTIPGSLSLCLNLEQISFEDNQLSGSLPPELGNLRSLKILSISLNNLTGEIPRTYGNLSALTTIGLARNQISGEMWDELRGLHNLVIVLLSENQLTGELPLWLFNISSLEYISLTENYLVGKLPGESESCNITKLRELYMAENRIGGKIPSYLFNSSRIQFLDLSSNQFEGSIPIPHNMKDLINLHLGYNNLSSTTEINAQLFNSLRNSTKIEILFLNSNFLSGKLPRSIRNLSLHLRELCLDNNFLVGRFPDGLERYKNLTALSIFKNSFSGNFPISVGKALKFRRVQAHQNIFSGEIPDIFGNLSQLHMLTLGTNQFSGRIPTSISGCKQMNTLGLASNKLSGSIPREIFSLSILRTLRLGSNKLTTPIPFEVGRLRQLETLDMSGNYLSGSIPSSIGECLNLHSLDLARNNLSSQIPGTVGHLLGLESLDLSHNNLSGTIPADLEKLRTLKTLNLSFNRLEGPVPRNGAFAHITWGSLRGNGNLCGSDQEVSRTLGISMCVVTRKLAKKHQLLAILIPVTISALLLLCAILGLIWMRIKRSGRREGYPPPLVKSSLMRISYEEIRKATDNFAPENFIGKGGFGSVYRGTFAGEVSADISATARTYDPELPGSGACTVTSAVKVIDSNQSKASKSFSAECEALKYVRHRNLVKIVTSCSSVDHTGAEFKALVMEFMCNGNLEKWLYPDEDVCDAMKLGLMQRVNIAIDVASAMDYLHSDCKPPIVHCDLKPGNVLLDDHLTARVGDFGLARILMSRDQQELIESSTVGLKGSIGYIAPEYGMGGRASTNGDVYSFGILLLELFIARKPTDVMFQEGLNLNKFASAVDENNCQVLDVVDPRLFSNYGMCSTETGNSSSFFSGQENNDSISVSSSNADQVNDASSSWSKRCGECVAELIRLGLSCARQSPRDRPAMREVLTRLHKLKGLLLGSIDPSCSDNVRSSASV
ncbi:probable LRR receptor-like serine/threonine-protein kinase At3g47570 [Punica granatum]|uniref:non-specific serine/threonine protein kinase n=1 Tax=Punica granatum TaxID=22663 RepID=A0A6P8DH14_PUNGR|nr:probable LRR receptor-like serine/threonine-protein kinase At3g47570 [Punica granatum]